MEGNPRRGTRAITVKQDHCFAYDDDSLRFFANRVSTNEISGEHRQLNHSEVPRVSISEVPIVSVSTGVSRTGEPLSAATSWLDVYSFPHQPSDISEGISKVDIHSEPRPSASQSHAKYPNARVSAANSAGAAVVNKTWYSEEVTLVDFRKSSTRLDFLEDSFDGVEQVLSEFSGMGDSEDQVGGESQCGCEEGNSCEICIAKVTEANVRKAFNKPADAEPSNAELMAIMRLTMKKVELMSMEVKDSRKDINAMSIEVKDSRKDINAMQYRLSSLEGSRPGSLRGHSSQAESTQEEVEFSLGSDTEAVQAQKAKLKKLAASKGKKGRVMDEKERGLDVVREKIRDRAKLDSFSLIEGEESGASGIFELRDVRKNMSKKLKKTCEEKVSGRIKEVGAVFPVEESLSSSSSSSGTDDSDSGRRSRRSRRRRKVKSGANLVKRPVKHTELWPHTLANEEEGEGLTCDTIGLPKFLSCFSAIMIGCGSKTERAGRASLLNAFSSVYECIPFVEARTFHNLVMTKIEQERISWKTDFSDLAEKFLNHKVRLSLRSKGGAAGSSSSHKSGRGSFPKGNTYSGYRQGYYNAARGKSFNSSTICKLWNSGTCSFGESCKYKHTCSKCAEAGKPGERHKAASCNSAAR